MTTVRKLSKSVPRPLSLVLGRTCRNAHVVSLPRLRVAHLRRPLSRLPFRRSAWCYAPSLPPFRYRRSRSAPSLRLPLVDASEMSSSRRRTSAAPIPASWPSTAPASSPRHTPTSFKYEKGGRFPVPLRVSSCYSSKPATTVSSVEDSNARAASVTGK